jgi:type IV pilus assembly protein PilN
MIKINLLASERRRAPRRIALPIGQRVTVACSLVLVVAGLFIGLRYRTLAKESARLDSEIANAQQETAKLHSIILQVQQFEQRRAQLQQRVTLIEQLRKEQTGPVHMLDEISQALPPMVWLTELKQTGNANEVLIEGRGMTVSGLPDFVANLEASGYFKKSVDIVSSQTEQVPAVPNGLIKFVIKAEFQTGG